MKCSTQFLRVAAVAVVSILALATPAQADILLEFDRLISGVEDSVRTIGEVDVNPDLVGQNCQVSVIGENQASVHPGNDLIVSTGGSSAVVVGVEDEVNAGINHTSQLVLGPSIVVQLRFGPDELSSLGFSLSFDCTQPTTTTVATTASTVAVGLNCSDGSTAGANGPTESTTATTDCQPISCDDGAAAVATTDSTTVTTAATGSDSATTGCEPASCSDDGDPTATTLGSNSDATVSSAPVEGGSSTSCPEPTSQQVSTTTTAPPVTAAPTSTTSAPAGSAIALPTSPVATAIAAAPAYAG